jgi:hypothetical protein
VAEPLARAGVGRWRPRSQPAHTVWVNAQDRERHRIVAGARADARSLRIDGEPQLFTIIESDRRWAAVRRHHGELTITIAGREVHPDALSLKPIADPVGELLSERV